MQDKLTKEEVLHFADLARIESSEEDLEVYQVKLKELLNQVDKILDITDNDSDFLIAPWNGNALLRDDVVGEMLNQKEEIVNAPEKSGNYIEVPVLISND